MMFHVNVHNVPEYAYHHAFVVVSEVDKEYYFWGAFDTEAEAQRVAKGIHGRAFKVADIV